MVITVPYTRIYDGIAYQADGQTMKKLVGEDLFDWGVPIPLEKGSAVDSASAGNVVEGTYKILIVPFSLLGKKGNPFKTDADPQPISVVVAADDHTIDVTIPIHGDPQVTHMQVYRTRVDETSPYFFAGQVTNGTTALTLNGNDASLPLTDFLESPVSVADDAATLAGPFRYGRPPSKNIVAIAMEDVIFVCGEEPYTTGKFSATDGSAIFQGNSAVLLRADMVGATFRYLDEAALYTIKTVETDTRFEADRNYERPLSKATDPVFDSYEILGDENAVAPSAPGEPEYFSAGEQFDVGKDDVGRIKGAIAHGQALAVLTETRIYLVHPGFVLGLYEVRKTASTYGTVAPRSVVNFGGSIIFYNGEFVCRYFNQRSEIISKRLGSVLKTATQGLKVKAISAVLGDRYYLAISINDPDFLDTISVLHFPTGTWDQWDLFKIVDMATVTSDTGQQRLYVEMVVGDGFGLFAFTDQAFNDGVGAIDYSGKVTDASGDTITVDTVLPTQGLGIRGLRVRIDAGAGKGQVRFVKDNTASVITLTLPWTTLPDTTSTFTVGAIELDALSGKIGLPDGHWQQTIKHSEMRLTERP